MEMVGEEGYLGVEFGAASLVAYADEETSAWESLSKVSSSVGAESHVAQEARNN